MRDVVDHGRRAAGVDDGDDRYGDEGGEHQQPLGDIGQRRAQESAEERVDHGDGGDEEHSAEVVEAEAGFEELAGGDHARRDVEREEHEDDDSADDAQQPGTVLEALLEEAGNRDRVTGLLRERAQARGHELPIDPGPGGQADRDPRFDEPGQIDGTGQAHEQPPRHIGGTGAQRRHTRAQSSPGEHIVVQAVLRLAVGEPTDGQHPGEVQDDRNCPESGFRHSSSAPSIGRGRPYSR